MPRQVLCSKDCKGLCPLCGKSLNEGKCGCSPDTLDPRFKKLLGVRIEETRE
ncbi:MAG: YceD family protein [Synergistaceae bacterium]|nr:YceD family protein [Synergistaceae bacterium]